MLSAWVDVADIPVSVAHSDPGGPFVYVNPAFEAVSGYTAAELVGGDVWVLDAADNDPGTRRALEEAVGTGRPGRARVRKRRADGSTWWTQLHLSPVKDRTGRITHVVAVALDITDQVRAEAQIAHTATHDGLTGLVTRGHFDDQLDRELARAVRDRASVGVLFLDVDGLKAVNDTHGHAAGDALLLEVATRLRGRLRGADLAGRYGGDEFVVLLAGLPGDGVAAGAAAAGVLVELTGLLNGTADVAGIPVGLSVSIGLSLYPRDGATAADLLTAADEGMYRHKRSR